MFNCLRVSSDIYGCYDVYECADIYECSSAPSCCWDASRYQRLLSSLLKWVIIFRLEFCVDKFETLKFGTYEVVSNPWGSWSRSRILLLGNWSRRCSRWTSGSRSGALTYLLFLLLSQLPRLTHSMTLYQERPYLDCRRPRPQRHHHHNGPALLLFQVH